MRVCRYDVVETRLCRYDDSGKCLFRYVVVITRLCRYVVVARSRRTDINDAEIREQRSSVIAKESTNTVKICSRTIKKEYTCVLEELINELCKQLNGYMKHVHYMNHQYKPLSTKRENLTIWELYLWIDLAENYLSKMHRETQAVHFGASREQYTIHTGVAYGAFNVKQCYAALSNDSDHGPPQIMSHLQPVLISLIENMKSEEELIKEMHFQSDSPSTQYRGKEMFAYLAQVLPEMLPDMKSFTWNYTEAGHGKGPVDGVGGRLKDELDGKVSKGTDINTYEKFKENAKRIKGIKVLEIKEDSISDMKSKTIDVKKFKGTMEVHQITWNRDQPNVLQFNYLSCFDCAPGTKCSHFHLGTLRFRSKSTPQPLFTVDEGENVDGILPMPLLNHPDVEDENAAALLSEPSIIQPETKISKNDWVALTLSGQQYPG